MRHPPVQRDVQQLSAGRLPLLQVRDRQVCAVPPGVQPVRLLLGVVLCVGTRRDDTGVHVRHVVLDVQEVGRAVLHAD